MRVYLDNNIASGLVAGDLGDEQMRALREIDRAHNLGVIEVVTSRESWREQDQAKEPLRGVLREARAELAVVAADHRVLGFSELSGPHGTTAVNPIVTDIANPTLFSDLSILGLKHADARHLMYACENSCLRFVTLDRDFLNRKEPLNRRCAPLRIVKPSELAAELHREQQDAASDTRAELTAMMSAAEIKAEPVLDQEVIGSSTGHMTVEQALRQVECLLDNLCPPVGGKDHYRTIRLSEDRHLGVDVFSSKNRRGHIRVHVYNVKADVTPDASSAPQVPNIRPGSCPTCARLPLQYPCYYRGPKRDREREYFGFQWHSDHLTDDDIRLVEKTSQWLLQRFPCKKTPG